MNFLRNNLANFLTLGNLFSGTIGVIHLINNDYTTACVCIIFSLILDFFDGFVARALKSNSNLGAQLDSLADMVSFGVLPGIAMLKLLEPFGSSLFGFALPFEIKYLGLFITLFSCLRLAIFNLDEDQKYYFKGLNTPSNTILILGLLYIHKEYGTFSELFNNPIILLILTILSSWLLVSPIKMIALKFKSYQLKDNVPKIVLLVGVILLFILLKSIAIPFAIIYYILVSIVFQNKLK